MGEAGAGEPLEGHRRRLFGVAYRMLGNVQDAEDLVQEAFLRWHQAPRGDVERPEAWLVSVVTRLAIDRLRRAATERAAYPGPWLPEPVAAERIEAAPDRALERASDLSMAFLVLLQRLAPEERAAFVMREACDASYAEIAATIDKSETATRQVVHRARRRVRGERNRFAVPREAGERLFRCFVAALESDDERALAAVLAPQATLISDGGGKINAARRPVVGARAVVRLLLGVERKYPGAFTYRLGTFNGEPALIQDFEGRLLSVTFLATDGARITDLFRVLNPDKLGEAR